MAREHRLRICVGFDGDGGQIIRQISAKSEVELGDAVVRALMKSGRLVEFIPEIYQQFEASKREPAPKKTNFKKYLEHWRQTYKTSGAVNTQVFRDAKQNILLRAFGNTDLEELRPDDVQRFLNERAKQVSKTTVKSDWCMLKEVLDSAVSDGIIERNPAKDSRLHNPAPEGKGTSALTIEQLKSIQTAIPTLEDQRERCLIALLAFTSMRREEALGLRWENVDFEHNTLAIREAIVFPVNKPVLKETKTKSSERLFPMGEELRKILWDCKHESGYVISTKSGDPISSVTYRRIWASLKSHIELYGASAMNFRTTFATMSIASGVDIRTTQALMGHSTPDMTLKVYTKTEPTRLPAAVEARCDLIFSLCTSMQIAAICTKNQKKRAAYCATLWCGKQDLNRSGQRSKALETRTF